MKLYFIILLISFGVDCARILAIFPTPSISHHIVFRPFINELIKRGHQCVVITPDPAYPKEQSPENLTEIDVHDVSYAKITDLVQDLTGNRDDSLAIIIQIFYRLSIILDEQLKEAEVKEVLKEKFDLVIAEAYVRPVLGFAHLLKVPLILMSTYGGISTSYEMLGAPIQPLLYPYLVQQKLYNLTYFEKINELRKYIKFEGTLYSMEGLDYEIMRRHFGKDVPSFRELYKNVQMLFLNEHRLWGDNHPVSSNIKHLGGLHIPQDKTLPENVKAYLDSSKNGVIYVSFGSNVMPSIFAPDKISMMLKVLYGMPYDVLFKWDTDNYPTQYSNIRFSRWFPQSDLLKHPKIKLFVTHGGLQSTDEAINAAVPVIGIPIFHDQFYNVEKFVHNGIGLQLDINTITENDFRNALNETIENRRYKNNMLLLRDRMREVPVKPLDEAVWWTEYILKHGGSHLTPESFNLTWTEYYEISLILTILLILVCGTGIILVLLHKIFKTLPSIFGHIYDRYDR